MLLKNGIAYFLALGIFFNSCKKDYAPKIDICILDGFGGMDCVLKDGSKKYLPPSETLNMWATTQDDMAKFTAWCYGADIKTVHKELIETREEIFK